MCIKTFFNKNLCFFLAFLYGIVLLSCNINSDIKNVKKDQLSSKSYKETFDKELKNSQVTKDAFFFFNKAVQSIFDGAHGVDDKQLIIDLENLKIDDASLAKSMVTLCNSGITKKIASSNYAINDNILKEILEGLKN